MANVTITALTAATSVAGADTVVVVQGGVTKKAAVSLLPTGSGGGGFALLARTAYNPGTPLVSTATDTTAKDADATNLAATFTVPASGSVRVKLMAVARSATLAGPEGANWLVREGTTTIASTVQRVLAPGNGTMDSRPYYDVVVTGLTPGASLTYKFGHSSTASLSTSVICGGNIGPGVIEVWAA